MRDCEQVSTSAKKITDAVSISSVLSRIDNDLQNKTMDLNRVLQRVAKTYGVKYINHDKNFIFSDGSVL